MRIDWFLSPPAYAIMFAKIGLIWPGKGDFYANSRGETYRFLWLDVLNLIREFLRQ